MSESPFMLEAHFRKAAHGGDIFPLHHGIHPRQVIGGPLVALSFRPSADAEWILACHVGRAGE
jgi:hypothetical protein